MKFGGFVATDSVADATEYARSLERWGWDALWAIDSQQLYTDLYVTLTACATETDELTLAPGITNPRSRHPSVTANAIASLEVDLAVALDGDRLAAAEREDRHLGRTDDRVGDVHVEDASYVTGRAMKVDAGYV